MGKTPKKFKPKKTYRYLLGLELKEKCDLDLKKYNIHRLRVFNISSYVDTNPLKFNPARYYKNSRLRNDRLRLNEIDIENKELVKRINIINRKGGIVNTHNTVGCLDLKNWNSYYNKLKRMQMENKMLYGAIIGTSSYYKTADLNMNWIKTLEKIKHSCKLPFCLSRPRADEVLKHYPSISKDIEKGNADRPLCYLEFQEKSGRPVGRIIIELYYDYVPVTAQNFLEICSGEKLTYKNCLVHSIIKGKFFESGDITKGNGRGGFSIYGEKFHEENHKLKHTRAGVISMKRIGLSDNNSQFCITFRKMEQLDHKNVVFGKVIKGKDTLLNIEGYGRKIGKPYADIIISKCGTLELYPDLFID